MKNLPLANSSLHLAGLLIFSMLLSYSGNAVAQAKIKRQHLYKLREGNRFEGIKTKKWKPVSGTLDLTSLIIYDRTRTEPAGEKSDSVSIYFYSSVSDNMKPSIFNMDRNYFMDPRVESFGRDWNKFTWSAKILNEIGLSAGKLEGVVEARQRGRMLKASCTWP